MSCACGCCEGVRIRTPADLENRLGLATLAYRVGTHDRFLASMLAQLSGADFPELSGLTSRGPDDPAIALIDGAALLLDVLTFYQERIACEGFLRTATERRSVLELARLVGYRFRPGVSASTFLAYTLEQGHRVVVPRGSKVQSIPGPGELPQTFETTEDLDARSEWNQLAPRLARPQWITLDRLSPDAGDKPLTRVYFKGLATGLKPGDPLLFVFGKGEGEQKLKFIQSVVLEPDMTRLVGDRTRVSLAPAESVPAAAGPTASWKDLVGALTLLPPSQLRSHKFLTRRLRDGFEIEPEGIRSGAGVGRLLGSLHPAVKPALAAAMRGAVVVKQSGVQVYALRTKAGLFGQNAPQEITAAKAGLVLRRQEWQLKEQSTVVDLDAFYEGATRDHEWLVLDASGLDVEASDLRKAGLLECMVVRVTNARPAAVARYGISGRVTRFELRDPWITLPPDDGIDGPIEARLASAVESDPKRLLFRVIRQMAVYTQAEPLELAEEPIEESVCFGDAKTPIELATLVADLPVGRWVTLSGERDIPGIAGVLTSELAMIASVRHGVAQVLNGDDSVDLPGDRLHTFVTLAERLAWCYRRETLKICANVVRANHGETRQEILGGGDASRPGQSFTLKGSPLTFTPAPTAAGADSSLEVMVNEVRWHEIDSFIVAGSGGRAFVTEAGDERKTRVTFGDGVRGARLPTGAENVVAVYRNGIGRPGNVAAGALSLLASKPLGVKEVVNPIAASGGADPDTRDRARRLVPTAVRALDRLVSVADYADFSRNFAGIGKADARFLSDGTRQMVYVTIAGADDIPILESSDLFRNLTSALVTLADPSVPVEVAMRELVLLVASVGVRIHDDYRWESVEARIRALLLERFGFEARDLGQAVAASELLAAVHEVPGVVYADLDAFGGIPEWVAGPEPEFGRVRILPDGIATRMATIVGGADNLLPVPASVLIPVRADLARFDPDRKALAAAQLAIFSPGVPETLVLRMVSP